MGRCTLPEIPIVPLTLPPTLHVRIHLVRNTTTTTQQHSNNNNSSHTLPPTRFNKPKPKKKEQRQRNQIKSNQIKSNSIKPKHSLSTVTTTETGQISANVNARASYTIHLRQTKLSYKSNATQISTETLNIESKTTLVGIYRAVPYTTGLV